MSKRSKWDNLEELDECCLCIPLREGTIAIATGGMIYGLIGLFLSLSIAINHNSWLKTYEKRLDLLFYLTLVFILIASIFFVSAMLLYGVMQQKEDYILYYLWSMIVIGILHMLVNIGSFIYCIFVNNECVNGSGWASGVVSIIVAIFYCLPWGYFCVVVNSYRCEM